MDAVVRPLIVRVRAIAYEAEGILSFDLRPADGGDLPPFTAGAHIDVKVPGGLQRSYSLINAPSERHRYVVAVQRDPESRGGSAYLCERLRPGELVEITSPANNFDLHEGAGAAVLIAGGIGITPLFCMIQRLEAQGKPWRLHFAARTRGRAAFLYELERLERSAPGRVFITFDHEPGQAMLDLPEIVAKAPTDAHLYCCGPTAMLKAFEAAAAGRRPETVHVEYFTSDQAAAKGGFEVVLARSRKTIWIPPDKTILETLLAEGMQVAHSCTEGVCGTCETAVLEGIPDHRDAVLSKREREANRTMMICRSGCLSGRLVLDL